MLSDAVVFFKPEDPVKFLLDKLELIKSGKATSLFSPDDLEGIFTSLDVAGKGTISAEQFITGVLLFLPRVVSDSCSHDHAGCWRVCRQLSNPLSRYRSLQATWVRGGFALRSV